VRGLSRAEGVAERVRYGLCPQLARRAPHRTRAPRAAQRATGVV